VNCQQHGRLDAFNQSLDNFNIDFLLILLYFCDFILLITHFIYEIQLSFIVVMFLLLFFDLSVLLLSLKFLLVGCGFNLPLLNQTRFTYKMSL